MAESTNTTATTATTANAAEPRSEPRMSDWERFKQVGKVHGLVFLGALTLWGAADAWAVQTDLLLAEFLAVVNAFVAATILAIQFHEWGHFAGARLSGSYSPLVRQPRSDGFIFGFIFEKNSRDQFLAMSIGGPAGNWLLFILTLALVPMDSWGRAMLVAVALARAISVSVFEVPIILRTLRGGDPQEEINIALNDGSGDRGRVLGYGIGVIAWIAMVF